MRAADVMTRPVRTVRMDDSIEAAAALLSAHDITAAPVLDQDGDLIGIVSEGDLLRAHAAQESAQTQPAGPDTASAVNVADVMTRKIVVMPMEADLFEIAAAMLDHKVHSVPIVDSEAELAGIVCRHDLLKAYVRTDDLVQLDVQHRLDQYAGGQRTWIVTVDKGIVEIEGEYVDEVERNVVEVLARTVPGVSQVRRHVSP